MSGKLRLIARDGDDLAVVIHLAAETTPGADHAIQVVGAHQDGGMADAPTLSGVKAYFAAARRAKHVLDTARFAPGAHQPDSHGKPLNLLAGTPNLLAYYAGSTAVPSGFVNTLARVQALYPIAKEQLQNLTQVLKHGEKSRAVFSLNILMSAP